MLVLSAVSQVLDFEWVKGGLPSSAVKIKKQEDLEGLRKYLGWKPINVVKDTMNATTMWAKQSERLPQRRHFKFTCAHTP